VRYTVAYSSLSSRTWFKHRWILKVVTILYVYCDKQQGKATKLKLAANIGFSVYGQAPSPQPGRAEQRWYFSRNHRADVVFFK
jgi:hypothetical protein